MKSYDIVGYTYRADTYCPTHAADAVASDYGDELDAAQCYSMDLDVMGAALGIDTEDEYSFDSDDFPKVIFEDSAADAGDRCGECGEWLVEPPETYDDRLDLLLALAHFTADYHNGQWSRLYRIGCRAHRRLAEEYGDTQPLDYPLNDTQRAIYDALVTNYGDDKR